MNTIFGIRRKIETHYIFTILCFVDVLPLPLYYGCYGKLLPTRLSNVLRESCDLRASGPTLREKVVAGLLFTSPAPPALVVRHPVDPFLEVRFNHTMVVKQLVILACD